jgi:BMFP domain-containing protein YqiC
MKAVRGQMTDVRARLGSVERHLAALLAVVPATSERIDKLEARLAALEARVHS